METTVGTENSMAASRTDMTPSADDLRPEKGTVSGDRPVGTFQLIFPYTDDHLVTNLSTAIGSDFTPPRVFQYVVHLFVHSHGYNRVKLLFRVESHSFLYRVE